MTDDFDAVVSGSSLGAPHVRAVRGPIPEPHRSYITAHLNPEKRPMRNTPDASTAVIAEIKTAHTEHGTGDTVAASFIAQILAETENPAAVLRAAHDAAGLDRQLDFGAEPAQLAGDADHAVRNLNHVLLAGKPQYPGGVYDTVGALKAMTDKLPEAMQHMSRWLNEHNEAGRLRSVDPVRPLPHAINDATFLLGSAGGRFLGAAVDLNSAWSTLNSVAFNEKN